MAMPRWCTVLVLVLVLAACGPRRGGEAPGSGGEPTEHAGVVRDTRTPLERRRDDACSALRPRLVACAVEDAEAERAAGRISQQELQATTSPEVRAKLGDEWMKACRVELSSRQVRVLEVCHREEPECGPLLACLEHLDKP
jgi:hypothetical protein